MEMHTQVDEIEVRNIQDLKDSTNSIVPESNNQTFGFKNRDLKHLTPKEDTTNQPRKMSLFKKFRSPQRVPVDSSYFKPTNNDSYSKNPPLEKTEEIVDLSKLPLLSGLSKLKARNINMLNSSLPLSENSLQNPLLKDQKSYQSIQVSGDRSNVTGTFSFQTRKETIDLEERLVKLRDIPEKDVLNFIDSFTPKFSQSVYQSKRSSVTLKRPEDPEALKHQIMNKLNSISKDQVNTNTRRKSKNMPKEENQDLKKFFTPRYAVKKNSVNISLNPKTKRSDKNWAWNEDSLISRYDAVHLSNRNLKAEDLAVESKALSHKPSSILSSESVIFKTRGKNDAVSNSSRNSRDSHYNPLEILNLTQPRFMVKRGNAPIMQNFRLGNAPNQTAKLPSSMSRAMNQRSSRNQKSTMKQLIKAASSRYESL